MERENAMKYRVDRLTMGESVVDETDVSAGCGGVELEIRDWRQKG